MNLQLPDHGASPDLPFVYINMAMTADGKIATANRAVSSFGSARDHARLLELRTHADAVMAGARTLDLNPVNLGPGPEKYRRARIRQGLSEYNLRIVVSGTASLNPKAEIFRHRFSPILLLTTARAPGRRLARLEPLLDEVRVSGETEIDFIAALRWLRAKWGVKRLLCEGGGELNDAMFRAGVVDRLYLTVCPRLFGGRTAPTIVDGQGFGALTLVAQLALREAKLVRDEMFFTFDVRPR